MKRAGIVSGVLVLFLSSIIQAQQSKISYETTSLGLNSWQYSYTVSDIALATPVKEFSIYFDVGLYQNLVVAEPTPDGWDAIVWQPEPGLGSGAYDALTIGSGIGIDTGETLGGFNVKFDWLGTGTPGSQFYEIINPTDFTRIDSGYTLPEPSMFLVMLSGLTLLKLRRK